MSPSAGRRAAAGRVDTSWLVSAGLVLVVAGSRAAGQDAHDFRGNAKRRGFDTDVDRGQRRLDIRRDDALGLQVLVREVVGRCSKPCSGQ